MKRVRVSCTAVLEYRVPDDLLIEQGNLFVDDQDLFSAIGSPTPTPPAIIEFSDITVLSVNQTE